MSRKRPFARLLSLTVVAIATVTPPLSARADAMISKAATNVAASAVMQNAALELHIRWQNAMMATLKPSYDARPSISTAILP